MHHIDADIPNLRTVVKFRNLEQNCMVIAANKAKSDAKNFREAAEMIQGVGGDRSKLIVRLAARARCGL